MIRLIKKDSNGDYLLKGEKMEFIIKEISDKKEKEKIAREILEDLTEWFGLPESTEDYIKKSQDRLFLACLLESDPVGFMVLNETSPDCGEIFVMGIKKKYHRQGLGKKLNDRFENLAKKIGYSYLQVKTVETGRYKEYNRTNSFYQAMGYKKLEVFPTLWDEANPCQIYVKFLG